MAAVVMAGRFRLAPMAAFLLLAGCSAQPASAPPGAASASVAPSAMASAASPSTRPTASASIGPSLDGRFVVDDTGREVAMTCWGTGSPTVFLEGGGPGLEEFPGTPLVRDLALQTRVCVYDRAGRFSSDPAPERPREAEDYAADLHALIRSAGIDPPVLLFGRSFGGMLVTFYAATYPEDVAGVVVFDTPAPSATMTEAEFPEGVWDHPDNPEHFQTRTGFEHRFATTPVQFDAPLVLISPTRGESAPADQAYWLPTSDTSSQVILDGGDEVLGTHAAEIAEIILSWRP